MGIGKIMKTDVPDGIGKMQKSSSGIGKMHGENNEKKMKKSAAMVEEP